MTVMRDESSYVRTRHRFDSADAARKYATRQVDHRRLRELQCILNALSTVPCGAKVLDLPCGTGSLAPALVDAGYQVTGADISGFMIEQARRQWELVCRHRPGLESRSSFEVQDVTQTTFPDNHFDAVVCNRLFHHFCEPEMRRTALAELRRICRGPIVVFYFDRFALDTIRLLALRTIFGKFHRDRIPIPSWRLAAEAHTVGLRLESVLRTRWGLSPQAFALLRRHAELGARVVPRHALRTDPPQWPAHSEKTHVPKERLGRSPVPSSNNNPPIIDSTVNAPV